MLGNISKIVSRHPNYTYVIYTVLLQKKRNIKVKREAHLKMFHTSLHDIAQAHIFRRTIMLTYIDMVCRNVYNYKSYERELIYMAQKAAVIMPDTQECLEQMGEQIKEARVRRGITADLVAERAGVSRATVWSIEKGTSSVSIGAYAAVLHALNGMDKDLLLIAKDEQLKETLRSLGGQTRNRAPRRNK